MKIQEQFICTERLHCRNASYGSAVTFGGKEIVSLTDILNKYEDDGGKLSEVENGEELKERLQRKTKK